MREGVEDRAGDSIVDGYCWIRNVVDAESAASAALQVDAALLEARHCLRDHYGLSDCGPGSLE